MGRRKLALIFHATKGKREQENEGSETGEDGIIENKKCGRRN
jgi:hypothetical protein